MSLEFIANPTGLKQLLRQKKFIIVSNHIRPRDNPSEISNLSIRVAGFSIASFLKLLFGNEILSYNVNILRNRFDGKIFLIRSTRMA